MKPSTLYLVIAVICIFAITATDSVFWADSADYVDSIIAFQQGKDYEFVEFGHLLWRPLGWALWSNFFLSADTSLWRIEIFSVLKWCSNIAALGSIFIFAAILKRLEIGIITIIFTCLAFIFSHAFLNFSQTATSYLPALALFLSGLLFSIEESDDRLYISSAAAGICLAAAFSFWIAFLWVIPAVLLAPLVFYGINRGRVVGVFINAAAFLFTIAVFYGIALAVLRIDTYSELKAWVASASHGNELSGVFRSLFGLARSFVYMDSYGILFKRFLLNDPYNPVSPTSLFNVGLLKVAAFYLLAAGISYSLLRNTQSRASFILLMLAAVPAVGFAILYDGGAIERYIPIFPFVFIAVAFSVQTEKWKPLRFGMIAAITVFSLINLSSLSIWRVAEKEAMFEARMESLKTNANPADAVFLVNWTDDLMNFNRSFPYNPMNNAENLRFGVIVTQGSSQARLWREEFALRSIRAWGYGQNVWLSTRAFSESPKADWNWAEGDDRNVRWHEFPEFFGRLETGEKSSDENGFTMIAPSETNKSFLQVYKDRYTGPLYR